VSRRYSEETAGLASAMLIRAEVGRGATKNRPLLTPNHTFLDKNGFPTNLKIEINECRKI